MTNTIFFVCSRIGFRFSKHIFYKHSNYIKEKLDDLLTKRYSLILPTLNNKNMLLIYLTQLDAKSINVI